SAGLVADRIGKARIAGLAMIVSGACCALAGFVFHAPAPIVGLFAVVWGVAVVADSAQLSALVAEYSPRDHVGTALTIQTCAGFLLTMASIRLLPVAAQTMGWQWVFLVLAPGPISGAFALRGLLREPALPPPTVPSETPAPLRAGPAGRPPLRERRGAGAPSPQPPGPSEWCRRRTFADRRSRSSA